ncbi:hypothetical protein KC19_9G144400 [Ceratodon purpureus]|uniref:Lipoxygenase n=1 Tax=Ceratodon purpureus TaxID=3225 RepID=A0A8T0GXE3_CERPU|nr:hypothetical protein KC19_9G144400 [Ceratodon purpureus]
MAQYKGTACIMKKKGADADDNASEQQGKHVTILLVSREIDPKNGKPLVSDGSILEGWSKPSNPENNHTEFDLQFDVPQKFGIPVAILVKNQHPNEFCLVSFSLNIPNNATALDFWANSWVANTGTKEGRVFFLNKACLPSDTPAALKEYRESELKELRGNGQGERKEADRIYDYDIYNDLGNPDADKAFYRRPLGGSADFPFPRRLRTGRPPTKTSPDTESKTSDPKGFYVPRDETFDPIKAMDLGGAQKRAGGHVAAATPIIVTDGKFESVENIKRAYAAEDAPPTDPLFPLPQVLHGDDNAWQKDAEFAREFLAGVNPLEIKLVTEFPIKSKLSVHKYGNPVSAISATHIEHSLEGLSIDQALSKKKLFVVDHHDVYLPLVEKINAQKGMKAYASRTLLFLSNDQTLKVLAIELALPGSGGVHCPGSRHKSNARVFTPPADSSKIDYVWELAKAHVMSNEMAAHQVTSHFGRSHAMTEPVIIATHRHLSKLHPIHQLMLPHFKYTLTINATAREKLIGGGGMFENSFTPGAHFLELVVSYYRDVWDFESQSLPNDLLKRGMAVPDKSAKGGVKLVIADYPYAADGLELWSAMKAWNTDYINIYYKDDTAVKKDTELQSWWTEFRTVSHADKKDAPGWPELKTKETLVETVTIMQWLASVQHAAVNFSQFDFADFMPQHPTVTRRLIPETASEEWKELQANPEKFYLSAISDPKTALTVMMVFEFTSSHAVNEEYIGDRAPNWTDNDKVKQAFEQYRTKLNDIDSLIKSRNQDKNLKNRTGTAGQMPYQILRPSSKPGITAMGIPNSVTV